MPAFAIEAALLAGVVRRPRTRRLHLLLLASEREEEGGAERRVSRDTSLTSDEDETDEEEIDEG